MNLLLANNNALKKNFGAIKLTQFTFKSIFFMKSIYLCLLSVLLSFSTIIHAQSPCDAVSVEVFGLDPQSGFYSYFGVRVSISQTYYKDITVSGYIWDGPDDHGYNENHPYTLTIAAGSLSAETQANFYQTGPAAEGAANITSVSPCPGPALTIQQQSENYVNWIDYNINYLINNNYQNYTNISAINNIMTNNLDAFYSAKGITAPLDPAPVTFSHTNWLGTMYDSVLQNSATQGDFVSNLGTLKSQITSNTNLSLDEKEAYSNALDLVVLLVQYCNNKFADQLTYHIQTNTFHTQNLTSPGSNSLFQFSSFDLGTPFKNNKGKLLSWWQKWGKCVFGTIGSSWTGQIGGCGTGAAVGTVGGVHGVIIGCAAGALVGGIAGAFVGAATFC